MRIPTRMTFALALGAFLLGGCGLIPGDSASSSDDTTERWMSNWCSVGIGMSSDQVKTMMGEPTDEYADGALSDQIQYEQGGYSFTVFLDTGGDVRQLQADYDNLGAEDRAKLACDETRFPADDEDDETPEVAQEASAESVLRSWVAAFTAGDGQTVCSLQARSFTEDMLSGMGAGDGVTCEEAVSAAAPGWRSRGYGDAQIETVDSTSEEATLSLTLQGGETYEFRLTLDVDGWKVAAENE